MQFANETAPLPPYAERLDALHRALEDDFRQMIGRLALTGAETVVDAGCGDGFFTRLLSERLSTGVAIGLDTSVAYLREAEARSHAGLNAHRVRFMHGSVYELPFDDASVDVLWSAHSMQSYDAIPHALSDFRRVLRPEGLLVILETDNIHSIMLSWPPDIELAARRAEHREIGSEDSYRGTYFPRFAQGMLREAGFKDVSREFVFIHRQQPSGESVDKYVELYLRNLLDHHGDQLSDQMKSRLYELAESASPRYLPRQENFFFGSLQVLITACPNQLQ